MNEHLKYEKQADRLIKAYKVNMPYYRIVNATKDRVIFEQAFSHAMATNPVSLEAFKESIKRGASYTNMSAVKPYMTAEEYKQLTRINDGNVCRVPEYKVSNVHETVEKSAITRYIVDLEVNPKAEKKSIVLEKIVAGNLPNVVVTNPEALKPYLIRVLDATDKKFIAEKILDGYVRTFCTGYGLKFQKNGDKARITFSMNKEHVLDDTTTIFIEKTKDNVHIKGKRNNNVLDRTYSWRTLQNYNSSNYERIIYKMHYDTCNDLKMTPFAFLFHPKYIASQLSPLQMKDFRNLTKDNSFPTVSYTCVDANKHEYKVKMRIDITSFKKFQDNAILDTTMDWDLFMTQAHIQGLLNYDQLKNVPYFRFLEGIKDKILRNQ